MKLMPLRLLIKYGPYAVYLAVAMVLGIAFASGCQAIYVYFAILAGGSLLIPVVVRQMEISRQSYGQLLARLSMTAGLFFLAGLMVAGIVGSLQDESFGSAVCDGAGTAARFATYMLKVAAYMK